MPYASLLLLAALLVAVPVAPARAVLSAVGGHPWAAPLDGPLDVARAFDPPEERWDAGHRGVDLVGEPGAVVRAAGAGTVTYAGDLAGRGVLVVTHGELRTTYEPVSALVDVGDDVSRGSVVATLMEGHGGTSAPYALLHWGLLRGETYLDPLLLLRRGPSRLVPVAPATPPAAATPVVGARGAVARGAPPHGVLPPRIPASPPLRVPAAVALGGAVAAGAVLLRLSRTSLPAARGSP